MAKISKRVAALRSKVDRTKVYVLADALAIVKDCATAKFDESIDISVNLGIDARKSDQLVRGSVVLPAGTGKSVRVAVFAQGDKAEAARAAGADVVGFEDLAEQVKAGNIDFDLCIATPDAMRVVGQLGQILGPRGLMPNPKAGTVVNADDLPRAIKEAKAGRVEFRLDKTSNIHVSVGKASFSADQLYENFGALMNAVHKARPSGAKGDYIKRITLTTTMGPGIKVNASDTHKIEVSE